MDHAKNTAIGLSLLASLLYGSQYVAIKEGVSDFDPILMGFITMTIGGMIVLAYYIHKGNLSLRPFLHWEIWVGGVVASATIVCQYTGLTMTDASSGGLIVGSSIIFVAPISAIIFHEEFGLKKTVGFLIGLLGLFTISTGWDLGSIASGKFTGDLILLGASVLIAITYPLTKQGLTYMTNYQWTVGFQFISAVILLIVYLVLGNDGANHASALPYIVYVGIFCTAVPTMLWAKGLTSLSMTTSATILLSESAFAVLLGALILKDPVTYITVVGAILIFIAIIILATSSSTIKRKLLQ